MSFVFTVQSFLTRAQLSLLGRKFLRVQDYNLPNNSVVRAFVYEKHELFLGQATLFGTIVLNSKVDEYSKNATDYLLLHEQGHQRVNPGITLAWLMMVFAAMTLILFGFFFLMAAFSMLVLKWSFALFPLAFITLFFGMGGVSILQHLSEGQAEYHAIKVLKPENFLAAKKEIKDKYTYQPKLWEKIWVRMSYPKASWIIALYRFFHPN